MTLYSLVYWGNRGDGVGFRSWLMVYVPTKLESSKSKSTRLFTNAGVLTRVPLVVLLKSRLGSCLTTTHLNIFFFLSY